MKMVVATERLAVDGGAPVRTAPFPDWPVWDERDEAALLGVLRSGQWGAHSGGGRVAAFEKAFASFQDAQYGVAVTNGTAALEVALRACGVGMGDDVIVPTDDPQVAETAWSVANVGRTRTGDWYFHDLLGSNFRLTEFQGALLLAQLERLPEQIALRERNAGRLAAGLAQVPGFRPVRRDPRVATHAWHLFMCRYDPAAFGGRPRADFLKAMR